MIETDNPIDTLIVYSHPYEMSLSAAVRTSLPVKSHWLPEESQKVFRIIWNLEIWIL